MSNNSYLEESNVEQLKEGHENGEIVDEICKEVKDEALIEKEKMMLKLKETEEEIETLRQVLGSKIRLAHYLRRTIGITPIDEIKDDINYGIKLITSSEKYKATTNVLQNAKQKTQTSLNTATSKISEKWDILRNTDRYKHWSGKVGNVQQSIKKHLTPPPPTATVPPAPPMELQTPTVNNETNNQ